MSKEDIIRLIQSFNSSLDVRFLEGLSKVQLNGYAEHLKAIRMKTRDSRTRAPVRTAVR